MTLTFTGAITQIGELKSIPTASGNMISKRELVLTTTDEEFPQSINVELVGEMAINFVGSIGQQATAYLRFTTSTSSNGRTFTNIKAWRMDV